MFGNGKGIEVGQEIGFIFPSVARRTLEHNNTSRNRKLFIHTNENIYRPHRFLGNVRN